VWVTNIDEDGASSLTRTEAHAAIERDASGRAVFKGTVAWGTREGVPVVGPGHNPAKWTDGWFPGPAGTRMTVFTFLPGSGEMDRYSAEESAVVAETDMAGLPDTFSADRPGMHISDSVDFNFVLSGEMYVVTDRGEALVKQGDVVVMRGGWHAWRNESSEPCTVTTLMLGAERR
jgi:mannose-6-phosphate isomerase-like protein (cupin superfamily)